MKIRHRGVRRQPNALCKAVAAALALSSAGPALAQSTAAAEDGPAADAPAEETRTLDTVIVTANKRIENVREVPSSISVVGQEMLENLHVTQLSDFAAYVPGLQVTSAGTPGQTTISLRGIAPISSGATVGAYVDETPLGSSGIYQRETIFQVDLLPYDIGRIEILRGPQGTLYGANSMGGLLKYVTVDPDLTRREFRIGGGVSDVRGADDTGWNVRFGANLPLVTDRLALRASYARNEIPGFIDNVENGEENINEGTQESARVSLLWQASDDVSLRLAAMRQKIDSENNASVVLDQVTRRPLYGDLVNSVFVDEPFEKDIDYYAATLDWNLGWADFTSATGYSDTTTFQRVDATYILGEFPLLAGQPPGRSFFDLDLDFQKFTQEFRLTSSGDGRFEWQLGAFYTKEDADNLQVIRLQALDGTPVAGLDPLAVAALPSDYEETAIFANASYEFTDRFKLGAGVRFSRNDQTFAQVVTDGILLPIGTQPGESQEDIFDWMISPQFKLSDDAMLYARVATGYQPGGPNITFPGVPPQVDASTLTSYEIGLKSELIDRTVLFDLAVFRIDWTDIQIGGNVGAVTFLVNGGEAVSQGVELSTELKLTERLRLGMNAAYTDATLSGDVPSIGGFEGDQLPYIPDLSASASLDYYVPLRGSWSGHLGGNYRWVGARNNAVGADPIKLDNYHAFDLNADISNDQWTFRAYVRNLTDERAYLTMADITSALTGVVSHIGATPIQPRTFGLEVDYRF